MKKEYDILVIGSGLGGLVSALILAKEGLKVGVLEKNNQYGGNLQTFSRDKLIFDTGVHYLGGLSPKQNLYQYFSYLGIMEHLKLQKMSENAFDKIIFGNDALEYPHAQGYDNFVAQLSQFFPDEKDSLIHYCNKIQKVCNQFPRCNLVGKEKYDDDLLHINAQEFIQSITSNKKLQAVLAGSNFLYAGSNNKTPLYVHALTVNSYIQSSYRCINGGSQISKLLIKELRKFGAEVFKHSEVTTSCFDENGTMTSVKTKKGKEFFAKKFISNIEIQKTIDLIGEKHFKKSFVHRVRDMEPITSCFSVYLVLKPKSLPVFNHNYYYFHSEDDVWTSSDYQEKTWPESFMLSCTPCKKNPKFAESITILTYMNYNEVQQWENTENTVAEPDERGVDYESFKKNKAQKILELVSPKLLGLKDSIDKVYTSTPLSYRDYIGSYRGNMYGYVKDSHHPLKTMISPKTKIENLFLTGQSINLHGILGVTIGAFVTCSEILGKEVIDERLQKIIDEEES